MKSSSTILQIGIFFLLMTLFGTQRILSQDLPSPETYFGHQMGAEGQIINFFKGLDYYKTLSQQSDRIQYTELGNTTDGNPFALLIISSPENLKKLDEIKAQRHRLIDSRLTSELAAKQISSKMPAVVFHTSSIHTTEISTAQVVPELVYKLVSSQDKEVLRILSNLIVLISPTANPDGQVKIVDWYEEHKGEKWEGRMPWQYHTYIGHDNNRDWVLLHFPEQRITAQQIHMGWHPIYSLEMHQMGGTGARIFLPPYQDPYDDNTAPEIVETMSLVGQAMSHRLTAEGKAGAVKNAIFDLFTPARAFQIYRGTARILTETASANFAKMRVLEEDDLRASTRNSAGTYHPLKKSWNFPLPWKGGEWTLRKMVEYQLSTNFAAMNLVAGDPYSFNMALYNSLKRVVEEKQWPFAYVVPSDQVDKSSSARLLQAMQRGGIEIHLAQDDFIADGESISKGSHVISLNQPYGAWAKTLMEIQNYPDLRKSQTEDPMVPYDVTSSTLPLMMGVKAKRIQDSIKANLLKVEDKVFYKAEILGEGNKGYLVFPYSNESFAAMDEMMDLGFSVSRTMKDFVFAGYVFPSGSFFLGSQHNLKDMLTRLGDKWYFKAIGLSKKDKIPDELLNPLTNPRIGIYEPWGGLMDAGWTRRVLEQWELEFTTVRNNDITYGKILDKYDIILFPYGLSHNRLINGTADFPAEFKGGIGEEGQHQLKQFVENGGTLAAFGPSSMALIEALGLPIRNIIQGLNQKDYYAPGSLVLSEFDNTHPIAYGVPQKQAVLLRHGPVFSPKPTIDDGPIFVGKYPSYDPRMSGFLLGPENLQGQGSLAVQQMGKGQVILFSMSPQFRAMTHSTYKLIFNSIFWSGSEK